MEAQQEAEQRQRWSTVEVLDLAGVHGFFPSHITRGLRARPETKTYRDWARASGIRIPDDVKEWNEIESILESELRPKIEKAFGEFKGAKPITPAPHRQSAHQAPPRNRITVNWTEVEVGRCAYSAVNEMLSTIDLDIDDLINDLDLEPGDEVDEDAVISMIRGIVDEDPDPDGTADMLDQDNFDYEDYEAGDWTNREVGSIEGIQSIINLIRERLNE